jgi:hypothetical protein
MLNGPCHIHSAFVDGKRISRHAIKDCKTFLKLQEAAISKQAEAKGKDTKGTRIMCLQQLSRQTMEPLKIKISQIKDTTMMEDMYHPKGTSQQ